MSKRVLIVERSTEGHHPYWFSLIVHSYLSLGWEVIAFADLNNLRLVEYLKRSGISVSSIRYHAPIGDRIAIVADAALLAESYQVDHVFFSCLDNVFGGIARATPGVRGLIAGRTRGVWFLPNELRLGPFPFFSLKKRWFASQRIRSVLCSSSNEQPFQCIYFLDEVSRLRLSRLNSNIAAFQLPDPYERMPLLTREEARSLFDVPQGCCALLHIGRAEPRKGLIDTVLMLENLCSEPSRHRRPFLLRVGCNQDLNSNTLQRLKRLEGLGLAKIVDKRVSASDWPEYFAACDWVLIPYKDFPYSSGILSSAVGARRPVIASDFGEIGRVTREEGLGLVFRHGSLADFERVTRRAMSAYFIWDLAGPLLRRSPERFMSDLEATL